MFDLVKWLSSQDPGFCLRKTTEGIWEAVGNRGVILGRNKDLPDCIAQAVTRQGGVWETESEETGNDE